MNTVQKSFISLFSLLCIFLTFNANAGGRAELPVPQKVVLSDTNTDAKLVRDAIVKAANFRTWTLIEEKPNQLTLKILVRQKHVVVIKADYDTTGYTLSYVSSENMDYKNKGKKAYIHSSYHRWLSILTADIKL